MDDLVGRQIGNYRVEALLGKGGMGAVYSGVHRFFGERVAIKVLHGHYADDPVIAERFFREAQAARDINHPSIITVKDFGQTDDGCLYLVMELLKGQTLGELLDRGALGEETAALVAAHIAEALAAAHAKNVVHRDLKPDNIFIVDGRIKLLDFGIAKVERAGKLTETGAMMGTPRYMSPEQVRGAKDLGPRSDLYSLGVILFEMVTGRLPYLAESVEVFVAILTEEPPVPSTLAAAVSSQMDRLILQLMAKDPATRPASAIEVRERLASWAPIHAGNTLPKPIPALQALARPTEEPDASEAIELPPLGSLARPSRRATQPSPAVAAAREEQPLMTGVTPPRRERRGPMAFALFGGLCAVGALTLLFISKGPAAHSAAAPATPPAVAAPAPPRDPAPAPAPSPAPPPAPSPLAVTPAAVAAPATTKIAIRSEPQGAEIVDAAGHVVGRTPDLVEVALPFKFTLRREGFVPQSDVVLAPEDAGHVVHLSRVPTRALPSPPKEPERILKSLD